MNSLHQSFVAIHSILADLLLISYSSIMLFVYIGFAYEISFVIFKAITTISSYMAIGFVVLLVGVVFVIWTRANIPSSLKPYPILIEHGLFAIVRHPMYTGWILINGGLALIALHWSVTILTCLQIFIFLIVIFAEDLENERVFGEPYCIYRKKVPITGVIIGVVCYCIRSVTKYEEKHEQD
jgi:protein-S-isoprenylcysteine O-methyltransferase Ste14